jgi:hypothetical protein
MLMYMDISMYVIKHIGCMWAVIAKARMCGQATVNGRQDVKATPDERQGKTIIRHWRIVPDC